jgi:hypothetical protein
VSLFVNRLVKNVMDLLSLSPLWRAFGCLFDWNLPSRNGGDRLGLHHASPIVDYDRCQGEEQDHTDHETGLPYA